MQRDEKRGEGEVKGGGEGRAKGNTERERDSIRSYAKEKKRRKMGDGKKG